MRLRPLASGYRIRATVNAAWPISKLVATGFTDAVTISPPIAIDSIATNRK